MALVQCVAPSKGLRLSAQSGSQKMVPQSSVSKANGITYRPGTLLPGNTVCCRGVIDRFYCHNRQSFIICPDHPPSDTGILRQYSRVTVSTSDILEIAGRISVGRCEVERQGQVVDMVPLCRDCHELPRFPLTTCLRLLTRNALD